MDTIYRIREMLPEHYDSAAQLWSLVFGDAPELVHEFYRLFGTQEHFAACAIHNEEVVAAAYCPQGTDLIDANGTVHRGTYLYAVATHPDHRKQHLATFCCRWLRVHTFRDGGEYLFTKPSEESLYPWYEENVEAFPSLGGKRVELTAKEVPPLSMSPMTYEEYHHRRNSLLQGQPHVCHSIKWLEWESLLHKAYGGGFYAVGDYIVDLYNDGTALQINELLPHPIQYEHEAETVLQGILAALGAERCVCTLHGTEHYVSVSPKDGNLPTNNPWFGPCYG